MVEVYRKLAPVILVLAASSFAHHIPGHLTGTKEAVIHEEAEQKGPGVLWTVSEGKSEAGKHHHQHLVGEGEKVGPAGVSSLLPENHVPAVLPVSALPQSGSEQIQQPAVVAVLPVNPVVQSVPVEEPEHVLGVSLGTEDNPHPSGVEITRDEIKTEVPAEKADELSPAEEKENDSDTQKEKFFLSSLFGSKAEETTTTEQSPASPSEDEQKVRKPDPDIPASPPNHGTTKWTIPGKVIFPSTKSFRQLIRPSKQAPAPMVSIPLTTSALSQPSTLQYSAGHRPQTKIFLIQPAAYTPQLSQPVLLHPAVFQPVLPRPISLTALPVQAQTLSVAQTDLKATQALSSTPVKVEKHVKEQQKEEKKKETGESEENKDEDVLFPDDPEEENKKLQKKSEENTARWFFGGWGGYYEPEYYYDYDYEYYYNQPYGHNWWW